MSTGRRCSIKEDHGVASITYWQCRRRSHPVQRMGGVCAMCLTERLSPIARCAETGRRWPALQLTDLPSSFGHLRLAGTHSQSVDSEGIDLNYSNNILSKQVTGMSAQRCDNNDAGVQEMSARDSSAGSEQSIASLIERDIDEGRQRYSDVTAGSKELALESSNSVYAKRQQLARSRSYSTNSHFNSKQSTPASYKSCNSSALPNCRSDACKFKSCNTARAENFRSSSGALLTKSKSTGSNYNGNSRHVNKPPLRSPAVHHGWSLPNFWHKKCTQMERRHGADASSATHDLLTSLIMQPDDSVPFMKMSGQSCSMSTGAGANFISTRDQNINRCMGIKCFTPSSFHLTRRSPSGKELASPARANMRVMHSSSRDCTPEPLIITQDVQDAAASSSSTAAGSDCSPSTLQVAVDACISKGFSVCRRWCLANFTIMSQKTARCRERLTTPTELGIISAHNDCSTINEEIMPGRSDTFGNQCSKLRDKKAGYSGCAGAEDAESQNGGEGGTADQNDCINGSIILDKSGKDAGAGAAAIKPRRADTSFTCTTRVECTPTLCSATGMQPNHAEECQSIAALVSMDVHQLIHLL